MLFDLKGRRRHVVQGVYLLLAVLMGGGLVLFGIGGGTSGGLLDAFKGGGGGSSQNSLIEQRIETAQKQLRLNPNNQAALSEMIRSNYQLAQAKEDPNTGAFTSEAKQNLEQASTAWKRYLATNPEKPDITLASFMLQAYGEFGLNQAANAEKAAEIVAAQQNSSAAYVQLVRYATLAGDTRTQKLAAGKALDLAPKGQRGSVKKLLEQAQAPATSQQTGTGGSGSGG
jgi:hypothetical protein